MITSFLNILSKKFKVFETFLQQEDMFETFLNNDKKYLVKIKDTYYFCFRHENQILKYSFKTKDIRKANILKLKLIDELKMYDDFKHRYNLDAYIKDYKLQKIKDRKTYGDNGLYAYKVRMSVNIEAEKDEDEEKIKEIKNRILKKIQREITAELEELSELEIRTSGLKTKTIKQGFEEFLEHKKDNDISEASIKKYKAFYKYLLLFSQNKENESIIHYNQDFFSDMNMKIKNIPKLKYIQNKLHKTANQLIEEYKDNNNDKLSNAYISEMFRFYNQLFKMFKVRRYTDLKEIEFIENKHKVNTFQPFNDFEIDVLLQQIKEIDYLDLCRIALYTGMRVGEIVRIQKKDVDEEFKIITIRESKTESGIRVIPIHKNIQEVLIGRKNNSNNDFIFEEFEGNVNKVTKTINRRIKKFIADGNKKFHSLRKNFTQELYRQRKKHNIDELTIKRILGHATNDLTFDIYNLKELPLEELREAIDSVEFIY